MMHGEAGRLRMRKAGHVPEASTADTVQVVFCLVTLRLSSFVSAAHFKKRLGLVG